MLGVADNLTLGALERRFDGPLFTAASRLARVLRRPRRASVREPTPYAVIRGGEGSVHLLRALRRALDAGAIETAEGLLGALKAQPQKRTGAEARQLRVNEIEVLLALGERDAALAVARLNRSELAHLAEGVALLELLGESGGPLLPGGRPHLLGLSRQIESGRLNTCDLLRLVRRRPWWPLRYPELHLLFASALWRSQSQAALRFLNRFLCLHGVEGLLLDEGPLDNVLASLRGASAKRMLDGPLVSVVVAAHEASGTLAYALDSLLGQTYANLEILVADDDSRDATLDVMQRYARHDRIRLFRSSRNQGAYNLRNWLAKEARGSLLTFHDADDFSLPSRIQSQVDYLQNGGVLGCVTSLLRVRQDGQVVFFKNQRATRLSRVSLMLPRERFFEVGPFRSARIGADEELHAQLRARFGTGAIGRLRAPLMLSLWSSSSATRNAGTESLEDGYRSPSRRSYSELVYRKYTLGSAVSDAEIETSLRDCRNYADPQPLIELKNRKIASAAR